MNNKNLLFFMTDQQRVDTIGMKINDVDVAPTQTRLANESAHFENAYNTCPLCVPARTALASGISPLKSGMLLNDLKGDNAPQAFTLHKMLYDAGYDIAHIGVNHITVSPSLKTALPYDIWQDDDDYAKYAQENGLNIKRSDSDTTFVDELCGDAYKSRGYSNANVSEWPYALKHFKDVWFCDKAIEYILQEHEKPFALFVCLWAPHPPLKVPKEYLDMFDINAIALPINTMLEAEGQPLNRRKGAAMQLGQLSPKNKWREAWQAHCALTRLCDDRLALLLEAYKNTGLHENTITVITTDHGEQLGQHKMYQKMEMYEPAVRVQAIFSVPDATAQKFKAPISHLDFVPTILDLLDIDFSIYPLEGQSLKACIEKGSKPKENDVFSVYCGNHEPGDMRRMIVRGVWKYVFDGFEAELYNVMEDALEMTNLAKSKAHAQLCKELHNALAEKWKNSYDTLCYSNLTY